MLHRTLFAIGLASSLALAQDIASVSKSPLKLARYAESHADVDWQALFAALGVPQAKYWVPPCGARGNDPCSARVVTLFDPDQQILIIHGGLLAVDDVYLRYMKQGQGWRFGGAFSPYIKTYPRRYEVFRFNGKPFLKIASDHSQIGAFLLQEVEAWFDLTQPGFDPVFSFTAEGSSRPLCFAVGQTVTAHAIPTVRGGVETIDLSLTVHFDGIGYDLPAEYVGVYVRSGGEKNFSLRSASSGSARKNSIPVNEFEKLDVNFGGIGNNRLLVYALPELRKIAEGSNVDARDCLRQVLENTGDTPEKKTLLELLSGR